MISTDLFMELNGDLVWIVDDDEIDYADNIKRSFRPDVYPSKPPIINVKDRSALQAPLGYYRKDGRFDHLFRQVHIPIDNFEWYRIVRRRRIKKQYE